MTLKTVRLDDLYRMVASIYGEQNLTRSASATFAHFVEVCGMLTIHDRRKKREGATVASALCRALGWYFPLLAKMRVASVEDLVYRKFPYACPYCRLTPHKDSVCKQVRGTAPTLDHAALQSMYLSNQPKRPVGLDDWQRMFQDIYPRETDDRGRSTIGLFEELGELAEAVRVFDKHPKYFLGEAADIFSYLMGIANEHGLRVAQEDGGEFSFEAEFLERYPGLCIQCGSRMCVCPTVPQATIGRMAKELSISPGESPFISDPEEFSREGQRVAQVVLEQSGGYPGLISRLPFDRGDTNHALVTLCLRVADAVQSEQGVFADKLRAEAVLIGSSPSLAGSPALPREDIRLILDDLVRTWRSLDPTQKTGIKAGGGKLVEQLGDMFETIRVLFVSCGPSDEGRLALGSELRAVQEALKLGGARNKVIVEHLPAATIDDLRRKLLETTFEIIHFSGHADATSLVFEKVDGTSSEVSLTSLADLIRRYEGVKCVILNACESVKDLQTPISPLTIGMDETLDDQAAIEFSRGFYDALAAGQTIQFAVEEACVIHGFLIANHRTSELRARERH